MLRIIQNSHAEGAKGYYSTADYYTEGQELVGHWRGQAASKLGLSGTVQKADWDRLCDNLHPETGKPLTLRQKADRTIGYDFNFHAPKSVSLLYSMTRSDEILEAFRESVDATMRDIEAEMQTRVRKHCQNEDRTTGNAVWGEFVHLTARPVNGVPDPHLHSHCFVFNTTWDENERAFKAGQFRGLKRDAPYFEAMFHSRFALKLAELGLPIERNQKGWEIGGIDKACLNRFSRRTQEIEAIAKEKGITDPVQKSELGAKSRSKKEKNLSFAELQKEWDSRLSDSERKALQSLRGSIGDKKVIEGRDAALGGVEYAVNHVFERASVVPERQLLAKAMMRSAGAASVEQVLHEASQVPFIRGKRSGREMVTTKQVYGEERKLVAFARDGRGTQTPIDSDYRKFRRDWLGDEQKRVVRHILESRDLVTVIRGVAGTGKTTLMRETADAIEQHGKNLFAFAPSTQACNVLREGEFEHVDTVARLLVDTKLQESIENQWIWIDEAGQLGTRSMAQLFEIAERHHARVLLSGDRKQHASVERGSPLKLLETEAGIVPAEIREIRRQQGDYKEAVKCLSEHKVAEGFDRLDRMGWVKQIDAPERYAIMADDYVQSVEGGHTTLAISPTHFEGEQITDAIRNRLRSIGRLSSGEREFRVLKPTGLTEAERSDAINYEAGDVLVFHQNAKGHKKGDLIEAKAGAELPLAQAKRFQHFHSACLAFAEGDRIRITRNGSTLGGKHRLTNGSLFTIGSFTSEGNIVLAENGWVIDRDFGHLTHGYVVTSHASQGKTVQHVLIGQSSDSFAASSKEQFYVSVSRGSQKATIYTDDKNELRHAIDDSDERIAAMDLAHRFQASGVIHDRVPKPFERHKELVHER